MTTDPAHDREDPNRVVHTRHGTTITIAELQNRVTMVEDDVVMFREMDGGTTETLTVMTQRFEEMTAHLDAYAIICDLAETDGSTSSDYRKFITSHFQAIHKRSQGRLKLIAVSFSASPVARVASKFLIGRMMQVPFTIEKDVATAHAAARKKLDSLS